MARAGIALGSNLGESLAHLRAALAGLREIASPGEPVLTAPVYQTPPVDCPPGSPDFLNTVVEIGFDGDARTLLACTLAIEERLGRTRSTERNAPRFIDIDLLYFDGEETSGPDLILPHPRILERRFVLQPLADIRPDLVLPGQSRTVATVLQELPADSNPPRRLEAAL